MQRELITADGEGTIRKVGAEYTERFAAAYKQTARSAVEMAVIASEVRDAFGYGSLVAWLADTFEVSKSTADRMLNVHKNLIVSLKLRLNEIGAVDPSALYLLAAPSTPDKVREKYVAAMRRGERVTHADVKEAVEAKKPRKESPAPPPAAADAAPTSTGTDPKIEANGPDEPEIDELEAATRDEPASEDKSQPWAEYNATLNRLCGMLEEVKKVLLGLRKSAGEASVFAAWVDAKQQGEFFDSSVAILKKHVVTNWASQREANRIPGGRNFFYAGDPKVWRDRGKK